MHRTCSYREPGPRCGEPVGNPNSGYCRKHETILTKQYREKMRMPQKVDFNKTDNPGHEARIRFHEIAVAPSEILRLIDLVLMSPNMVFMTKREITRLIMIKQYAVTMGGVE